NGRRVLHDQARTIRSYVSDSLSSFSLDDNIALHTEGALGQDYEASTIAYRFYTKNEIPDDQQLDRDLEQVLTAYDRIIQQKPKDPSSSQWWIFQANPKLYNIDGAIHDLSELTWTVKHEATRASVGDRVFFWRAGREAGVVALGTIIEAATSREILQIE